MPFSLLYDKISRQHRNIMTFKRNHLSQSSVKKLYKLISLVRHLAGCFFSFFYMLNLERSIVRIIPPYRRWMSRDFEDLSEELYCFNKMNQMCQVIKLWSNAELTVEKTQEHFKASGYRKTRREKDKGYWKVSVVHGLSREVFLIVSCIIHIVYHITHKTAAVTASNPVHFPRVQWFVLKLADVSLSCLRQVRLLPWVGTTGCSSGT